MNNFLWFLIGFIFGVALATWLLAWATTPDNEGTK